MLGPDYDRNLTVLEGHEEGLVQSRDRPFEDIPRTYSHLDPKVKEWYRDWRERLHHLEWAEEEPFIREHHNGTLAWD